MLNKNQRLRRRKGYREHYWQSKFRIKKLIVQFLFSFNKYSQGRGSRSMQGVTEGLIFEDYINIYFNIQIYQLVIILAFFLFNSLFSD